MGAVGPQRAPPSLAPALPTPAGRQALHELDILQHPWANEVRAALGQEDLSILASLLRRLTAACSDHRRRVASPVSVPVMDEGEAVF